MDLRQLDYLVAVADQGGFTRAAERLQVSQPSLSNGIKNLEAELGLELIARRGRTVAPTPAGEEVIAAARRVLRGAADVVSVAAAVRGVSAGRLDVVALATLAMDPLPGLIGPFRVAHPAVTLRIYDPDDTGTVDRVIAAGQAELGLTDLTTGGSGLRRVELFRQELLVACPPGTDLDDGPLRAHDLARLPLVTTPPGTSTRRVLDAALARAGTEATIAVESGHRDAILPLVLAGAGAAVIPAPLAAGAAAQGAVVRSLRPSLSRRVGLLHRPGALSPAAAAFLALAVATLRPPGVTPRKGSPRKRQRSPG